ncbi:trypsin-like peptidase domain-containing protein [Streptomyces sp. JJ66]|uniref:trypsin-like serine peptidase n=1 Tax=Streptomyces sp. JJ66 TaxID=2803843 RepID=UPI001C58C2F8|nr:serine protease [Streptomyces sp. JJ66]MBW1602781.1 trypsin-like peptidase domain-containing protein [Streptomyces sp. JJ66]
MSRTAAEPPARRTPEHAESVAPRRLVSVATGRLASVVSGSCGAGGSGHSGWGQRRALWSGAAALLLCAGSALGLGPSPAVAAPLPGYAHPALPVPVPPVTPGGLAGTVVLSNCSGALVRMPHSRPADPALVLTNGHCLTERGVPRPGEVVADTPSQRTFTLLDVAGRRLGTLRAARLAYATVTGTDVALYRLGETYADVTGRYGAQAHARTLDSERPSAGTRIDIPSSYWKHVYHCAIDGFVPVLREGPWTMTDSLRYTRSCATVSGTSGAPVIERVTGQVVGVNSTGNDEGGRCGVHNPCEIDAEGAVTVRQGTNYGQQTYPLTRCVTAGSTVTLEAPGCTLPRP